MNPLVAYQDELSARLSGLARYLPLIERIESFWLEPINQQSNSWTGIWSFTNNGFSWQRLEKSFQLAEV